MPSLSARRIAITVVCNPCSNGKAIPRSVARQSAAISSAVRTRSLPSGSAATRRHYPSPLRLADAAATWGELPIGGIAERS